MRYCLYIYFFLFLIFKLNCFVGAKTKHVVIFVHGTIVSKKDIICLPFHFTKKRWDSFWVKTIKKRWARDITTIKALYGNKKGLHVIDEDNVSQKAYFHIYQPFKKAFEKYISADAIYCMYNWSGSLQIGLRTDESKILTKEIIKLKKDDPSLIITFICHSHGGNLVLEVAEHLKDYFIIIDNLILLGTPIGFKSEEWAKTKNIKDEYIFKNIFIFYSKYDFIQPLDIFFNKYSFCRRNLKKRKYNVYSYEYNDQTHWGFYYNFNHSFPFVIKIPEKLKYKLTCL